MARAPKERRFHPRSERALLFAGAVLASRDGEPLERAVETVQGDLRNSRRSRVWRVAFDALDGLPSDMPADRKAAEARRAVMGDEAELPGAAMERLSRLLSAYDDATRAGS